MDHEASNPTISFIMPAYNAGKYIARAIDSIKSQTVTDWELIIVDDASSDNTLEIMRQYAEKDCRIKYMSLSVNHGNAYGVRKIAIEHAGGEFVSPLDADDWIEPTYLEKLVNRIRMTNADIVYPMMQNPASGIILKPVADFDMNTVGKGRDLVIETLNGWKIGAGGGVIRKSLYLNLFSQNFNTNFIFSDEYLTRRLLYDAEVVAFSDAKYFYFMNDSSVTHRPTSRIFDLLTCDTMLDDFIKLNYGHSSRVHTQMQLQRFFNVVKLIRYLNGNSESLSHYAKTKGLKMIRQSYGALDWKTIHDNIGWKYYYLMKSGISVATLFLKVYDKFFPEQK